MRLEQLNQAPAETFCQTLASLYEHSPWVPVGAVSLRPFASEAELRDALRQVVDQAPAEQQLALLRAHPNLAAKVNRPDNLTAASQSEQSRAGFDALSPDEATELLRLNQAYQEKFGFPFIQCVRASGCETVISNLHQRLTHTQGQELPRALQEVHLIATYRLSDLLGGLT